MSTSGMEGSTPGKPSRAGGAEGRTAASRCWLVKCGHEECTVSWRVTAGPDCPLPHHHSICASVLLAAGGCQTPAARCLGAAGFVHPCDVLWIPGSEPPGSACPGLLATSPGKCHSPCADRKEQNCWTIGRKRRPTPGSAMF